MGQFSPDLLFETREYRSFIRLWTEQKGRGELKRIAIELRVHTTLISQILSGRKGLTEEQAQALCSYMSLTPLQTDYFIKMVQMERAGTASLQSTYRRHLAQLQLQSRQIKERVPESKDLSEADQAIFYSSWYYSYIRLLTSLPNYRTKEEIAARVNLPIPLISQVLDFLVTRRLCDCIDNKFFRTKINTHIEAASPLSVRHHQNWRTKSLAFLEKLDVEDLAFTAPLSMSRSDAKKVRRILVAAISEVAKVVQNSEEEELFYIGIDWMKI